jgi:hypothetical protein
MADHATQRERILALLQSHEWIALPQILGLYIANYRARISELRREGYEIQLRDERVNGGRHTSYRLVRRRVPQQLSLSEESES